MYAKCLGMQNCFANCSNKTWIFWKQELSCTIYASENQITTCKIQSEEHSLFLSIIYAKSKSSGREDLWMYMRALASVINHPWAVAGDINNILSREEKLGGIPYTLGNNMAFTECLNDCALSDIGYTFRENRISQSDGNIFWQVHQKIKMTSRALSHWSKMKIGNIFEKSQQLDKEAEQSEEKYMKSMDPIDKINMNRIKAELITHHKHVDTFWRQKANFKWNLEGDENTR
ncbi:uncharacterized protein LOC125823542 [Solanum verrucosum]|uniref:uncharacterized protein LOC125823542 n=1 Tax=Solanum verrucosum TaxID=315347 RepID=UPI0020D01EA6|nr:uncharacterized protein LOC125823542 [Solanum verrucosum]